VWYRYDFSSTFFPSFTTGSYFPSGFSISAASIFSLIESYISTNISSLETSKWSGFPKFQGTLKTAIPDLRWADGVEVKTQAEKAFEKIFGPKGTPAPKTAEPTKVSLYRSVEDMFSNRFHR
jgi:hypothetical protein